MLPPGDDNSVEANFPPVQVRAPPLWFLRDQVKEPVAGGGVPQLMSEVKVASATLTPLVQLIETGRHLSIEVSFQKFDAHFSKERCLSS